MGAPLAGYLLQAAGVDVGGAGADTSKVRPFGTSIRPYRPAIFYAGGVALASAGFVAIARLRMSRNGKKCV
jgi:hypothetical protein